MTARLMTADLAATLPTIGADLTDLDGTWHRWPHWDATAIVRRVDETRWVALTQMIFTWALISAPITEVWGHDRRWCYHTFPAALAAGWAWDGTGEPQGWHRRIVMDGSYG